MASKKIQGHTAQGHQNIEYGEVDFAALEAALFPDYADLYHGPSALTVADLTELFDCTAKAARSRARKAVKRGELVTVHIKNDRNRVVEAWVPVDIYEQWKQENDANVG